MAGISRYFHGERGTLIDRRWVVDRDGLFYRIELEGNPHRRVVYSYGSDILIDPAVRAGQEIVYLRRGESNGIWVSSSSQSGDNLLEAEKRAERAMTFLRDHGGIQPNGLLRRFWALWLRLWSGIRVEVNTGEPAAGDPDDTPANPLSLFLSFSSHDALIARRVYEGLTVQARADPWFDLTQPGDSPQHEAHVASWLRESVFGTRLFVVLLTQQSSSAPWVQREIQWAREKASEDDSFFLVFLKLSDVADPSMVATTRQVVIDCREMYWHDVSESLYAAIYERRSRAEWIAENPGFANRRELPDAVRKDAYWQFTSGKGTAVGLNWQVRDRRAQWTLTYRDPSGSVRTLTGPVLIRPNAPDPSALEAIVDPGIEPGDSIGYGRVNNRGYSESLVWMRSRDMTVSFDAVGDAYARKVDELEGRIS